MLAVSAPVSHFLQIQQMEDDTDARSPIIWHHVGVRSASKSVIVRVAGAWLLNILAASTAIKETQVYSGVNQGLNSLCYS